MVVYWWWNHNLCVRYVYLLKAGLNMELTKKGNLMEKMNHLSFTWVQIIGGIICLILALYDYASGYFGAINSSLENWANRKL